MADYNVWADLFDTWQSTSDWVKALVIVVPPVFAATVLALLLRYRQKTADIPVHSGIASLSAVSRLQPEPADMPELGDTIDLMLLDAATNLQHRLEDARRLLNPQESSVATWADLGRSDIRQQITQIILEDYHRGSEPEVALRRARQFLADQRNAHGTNPDATE
ncbi:protein kinase [Agrobacterium vitis]|uniref:protein kinase n=1 Tax=Agrobacterium vitis TaxID=373 RepID=UPI0012E70898|nr:protein kinase [Agrobacterium vitis]MUZ64026.1 protein kinase [Agrobacterium vitis]